MSIVVFSLFWPICFCGSLKVEKKHINTMSSTAVWLAHHTDINGNNNNNRIF